MLQPTPMSSPAANESMVSPDSGKPSLRSLFDLEETNLLRFAFSITGRRVVAEEIVQEVFLQLHAKWQEVDSPRAWLYQAVKNRALNHHRKAKREVLQSDGDLTNEDKKENADRPDDILVRSESTEAVRALIEQLSETDQLLIRLKYFENLKYREISERTGLTVSNVGYRLHQIMQQLANGIRPFGIDESQ